MAKLSEADALEMLSTATALVATLSSLIPQLVVNYQAIKDGLASSDNEELNAKIIGAHDEIQALDAKLAALRS